MKYAVFVASLFFFFLTTSVSANQSTDPSEPDFLAIKSSVDTVNRGGTGNSAKGLIKRFIKKYPDSPYLDDVYLLRSVFALHRNDPKGAKKWLAKIEEDFPKSEHTENAQAHLATIDKLVDNLKKSDASWYDEKKAYRNVGRSLSDHYTAAITPAQTPKKPTQLASNDTPTSIIQRKKIHQTKTAGTARSSTMTDTPPQYAVVDQRLAKEISEIKSLALTKATNTNDLGQDGAKTYTACLSGNTQPSGSMFEYVEVFSLSKNIGEIREIRKKLGWRYDHASLSERRTLIELRRQAALHFGHIYSYGESITDNQFFYDYKEFVECLNNHFRDLEEGISRYLLDYPDPNRSLDRSLVGKALREKRKRFLSKSKTITPPRVESIVDEMKTVAWSPDKVRQVQAKYYISNSSVPDDLARKMKQILYNHDDYWNALPDDSEPKKKANAAALAIRNLPTNEEKENKLEQMGYSVHIIKYSKRELPAPIRNEFGIQNEKQWRLAKIAKEEAKQAELDKHLVEQLNIPEKSRFSFAGLTFGETQYNDANKIYLEYLREHLSPEEHGTSFAVLALGLDRSFGIDNSYSIEKKHTEIVKNTSMVCYSYKAVLNDNIKSEDCLYFYNSLLIGMRISLSQANCGQNCTYWSIALDQLKKGLPKSDLLDNRKGTYWIHITNPDFQANFTIWGLRNVETKWTLENSAGLVKQVNYANEIHLNGEACVFPKKLAPLFAQFDEKGKYTCYR